MNVEQVFAEDDRPDQAPALRHHLRRLPELPASVIRVDGDGFVIAEFNFFGRNGGGNGILDFRKVTSSTPDNPIAFIR